MISRRHHVKVMYMGVVAPPNESKDFDWKIYFKRVSQKKETQKETYSQRFSDDGFITSELRYGK
eukprot:10793411-Ditylum_brightwellii.AAC.1